MIYEITILFLEVDIFEKWPKMIRKFGDYLESFKINYLA